MTTNVAVSLHNRIQAIQAAVERSNTWEPASLRAAESVRIALDTIFHGNRVFRMAALTAIAPQGPFGGVKSTLHISASAAHEILKRLYPNDGKPGVDAMDPDFVTFLRQIVIGDRRAQKEHLLKSRRVRTPGTMTWNVFCPICDQPGPTDMHENIVTRGNVAGQGDIQSLIWAEENCNLVHAGECHERAQTGPGRLLCAKELVTRYGTERLHAWVNSLGLVQPVQPFHNLINQAAWSLVQGTPTPIE